MIKIPSRVKIVKNVGSDYYNQFIFGEYDVICCSEDDLVLPIPSDNGVYEASAWLEEEVEVLEWKEAE